MKIEKPAANKTFRATKTRQAATHKVIKLLTEAMNRKLRKANWEQQSTENIRREQKRSLYGDLDLKLTSREFQSCDDTIMPLTSCGHSQRWHIQKGPSLMILEDKPSNMNTFRYLNPKSFRVLERSKPALLIVPRNEPASSVAAATSNQNRTSPPPSHHMDLCILHYLQCLDNV